jgi:hypothetical protein
MIVVEPVVIEDQTFNHRHSDSGVYIHGGNPEADYADAMDPVDADVHYVETDIPIEPDEEITDAEALAIITGEGSDPT